MVSGLFALASFKTRRLGGANRNRTDDKGFADLCLTAWLWRRLFCWRPVSIPHEESFVNGKFQIFSDIFKILLSLAISPPTGAKENSGHPSLPEFSPSSAPSLFFILWSLCPELPQTAHWFQRNAPHSAFLSAVWRRWSVSGPTAPYNRCPKAPTNRRRASREWCWFHSNIFFLRPDPS